MRAALLLCALAGTAVAQTSEPPTTTPVPILKQVNQVNEDGSYTFGFEAADGSFKLETRSVNGEVTGKYGYVDVNGVRQVFDYSASEAGGFNPSSSLIPNPPPRQATSASDVAPGTMVGDIDISLEGYSEDLDQDGFVDPIPTDLQQTARRPAARARPAPMPRPVAPARFAPAAPAAPIAPAARPAGLPASTFGFRSAAPQLPPQLPRPQQAVPQQQFVPQQRQFLPRQPQQLVPQQFIQQQPQQRQLVPQQFIRQQPQQQRQLVPQQFNQQQPQQRQFVPQQRQFLPRQLQQFAPQQSIQQQPQQLVPQQIAPRARAQLLPQRPAVGQAGAQRFLRPVQGFNAQGGVVNGFQPVPAQG